jgi:thiamine-phosphate pyrophosphorylase
MNIQTKLIVISSPYDLPGEQDIVSALFDAGLETFHLRKPAYTQRQTANFLKRLSPDHVNRIVLHSHWSLAEKYPVMGIHGPSVPKWQAVLGPLTLSRSCHDMEEMHRAGSQFHYFILSPIFDSISKPGYRAAFDLQRLKQALTCKGEERITTPVYALGGVNSTNIATALEIGFSGVAVLGAVWHGQSGPLDSFNELKEVLCHEVLS